MPEFSYQPIFELTPSETAWRKLPGDFVATASFEGRRLREESIERVIWLISYPV